ncbi:polysaccharide deacetylase family protein [Polaribacter septentrionalilitoris]|uniref:polysaccharide deacetylase family protein n=1 Tax=Polaribacter septentrionalilitoris TaxID=2494657 RepID=UPI0019159D65|nr:polysaccharide deacetylase family protein [Polaribacter septentrionalilitoris]
MKAYFPRTPRVVMKLFSKYTWRFHTKKKEIFLTFDDGPTPEITQFVLDELQKYDAKATFFCIGKNIEKYPNIFAQIIADGHAIGNHTQNHLKGWKTNTITYLENILECEEVISKEIEKLNHSKNYAQKSKLFRPPYGKIKKKQAKKLIKRGYEIIMWNVLSADFNINISKEECLENVLENTKEGSIIVFHDSIKAAERMQYALPRLLKEFSNKGFTFSSIK